LENYSEFRTQSSGGSRKGFRGALLHPLIWVKKEEITEGRKGGRARQNKTAPSPPLAQGLDPPMQFYNQRVGEFFKN